MMRGLVQMLVLCVLPLASTTGAMAETAAPAAGVMLVAAPVGPAEDALVEALTTRLRALGLTVRDAARRGDGKAPEGRLDVRFDRTAHGTAVWVEWRGATAGRGWTVRLDALDDPETDARALVDALDVNAMARGDRRSGTGRVMRVGRRALGATRFALSYNGAGLPWGVHQIEGEVRWSSLAVGVGYSYSSWDRSERRTLAEGPYIEALEGSAHGLRADVRWYGNPTSDWYLFASSRVLFDRTLMLEAQDEVELDGMSWINTLGVGRYLGGLTGPFIGLRGGVPFFSTSTEDNYGRTTAQTLVLGFDAEVSAGWRF